MNAFDTSSPSRTGPTKAERAYTRQGLERTARVGHMSAPRVSRFSTPIVSRAAQDKTNAIRNSGCYFTEMGEQDRERLR